MVGTSNVRTTKVSRKAANVSTKPYWISMNELENIKPPKAIIMMIIPTHVITLACKSFKDTKIILLPPSPNFLQEN